MSDLKRTAEMERLIQLLLHDLRSPLGVAQGYVSLLDSQQLSVDDRLRALRGISDAIARMSKLVDDVAALLGPDETASDHGLVEAAVLCQRVAAEAARLGMIAPPPEVCGPMRVQVGTSVDQLAESIAVVLTPSDRVRRANPPMTLGMSYSEREIRFAVTANNSSPTTGDLIEFDPEAIGTVEHLRAHRHISMLQGRVWRQVGESRACGVTLPLCP